MKLRRPYKTLDWRGNQGPLRTDANFKRFSEREFITGIALMYVSVVWEVILDIG